MIFLFFYTSYFKYSIFYDFGVKVFFFVQCCTYVLNADHKFRLSVFKVIKFVGGFLIRLFLSVLRYILMSAVIVLWLLSTFTLMRRVTFFHCVAPVCEDEVDFICYSRRGFPCPLSVRYHIIKMASQS